MNQPGPGVRSRESAQDGAAQSHHAEFQNHSSEIHPSLYALTGLNTLHRLLQNLPSGHDLVLRRSSLFSKTVFVTLSLRFDSKFAAVCYHY